MTVIHTEQFQKIMNGTIVNKFLTNFSLAGAVEVRIFKSSCQSDHLKSFKKIFSNGEHFTVMTVMCIRNTILFLYHLDNLMQSMGNAMRWSI